MRSSGGTRLAWRGGQRGGQNIPVCWVLLHNVYVELVHTFTANLFNLIPESNGSRLGHNVYTSDGGCADDDQLPEYIAYRMEPGV